LGRRQVNLLFSGRLAGTYGDISLDTVQEYCRRSGINLKMTEYNPDYDKVDGYQHMMGIKDEEPVKREDLDWKVPGVDN
jgi:hypothetical protein